MAEDAPRMRGDRSRNESGSLRATREDKHVGTVEKQYGRDFGVRSDMHIGTLLQQHGLNSVKDLLKSNIGR